MRYLVLTLALLLAACEKDQTLLSGSIESEFAACSKRLASGEFKTHEERATCDHWGAVIAMKKWAMAHLYGDLVALLSVKRKELATLVDSGALSQEKADIANENFYARFLEEIIEREKRKEANYPADYLNYCEIHGDNLRCTRPPEPGVLSMARKKTERDCNLRRSRREIVSFEDYAFCIWPPILEWRKQNELINNDLAELMLEQSLRYAKQVDDGKISISQFSNSLESLKSQIDEEGRVRYRLATNGDLNWRNRKCRIEDVNLKCKQI